jgi:hypothetical protein
MPIWQRCRKPESPPPPENNSAGRATCNRPAGQCLGRREAHLTPPLYLYCLVSASIFSAGALYGVLTMSSPFPLPLSILAPICAGMEWVADPRLPIWSAAEHGLISLHHAGRCHETLPPSIRRGLQTDPKPTISLVDDCPDYSASSSVGPSGWRAAWRFRDLLRDFGTAVVDARGPCVNATQSHRTVAFAIKSRRLIYIETTPKHAIAWRDFMGRNRTIMLGTVQ